MSRNPTVHGQGEQAFDQKLLTGKWQLFGGTFAPHSLPLAETAPTIGSPSHVTPNFFSFVRIDTSSVACLIMTKFFPKFFSTLKIRNGRTIFVFESHKIFYFVFVILLTLRVLSLNGPDTKELQREGVRAPPKQIRTAVEGNTNTEIDRDVERNKDFLRFTKKKSSWNKKREEAF